MLIRNLSKPNSKGLGVMEKDDGTCTVITNDGEIANDNFCTVLLEEFILSSNSKFNT